MEPRNRLREIFEAIGLENVRPSEQLLTQLGLSLSRFNQLLNNKGRIGITVAEGKSLEKWLRTHFQGPHQYLFADDMPPHERLVGKQHALALH